MLNKKHAVITIALIILFSQVARVSGISSVELVFAKVLFSEGQKTTVKYIRILDNRISFFVKSSLTEKVTIFLDPRSGLRPIAVKVNGNAVSSSSPNVRYGFYEVEINTAKLGSGTYEILFEKYDHLPIAFIIFIPENFTKIGDKEKIYMEAGEWKVYGYFIYVLTLEEGVIAINTSKPYSLLSEREVEYITPLGPSKGKELIYYVQDSSFTVEGDVVSLAYKPLLVYYEDIVISNSNIVRINSVPEVNLNGTYYLVLYKPEYIEALIVSEGNLAAGFPFNLSLGEHVAYIIERVPVSIEYKIKEVEIFLESSKGALPTLNVEVESNGRILTLKDIENSIHIFPPLKFPMRISLYYNKFRIGEYLLYTIYNGLTLEVALSKVKAYITDITGKKLERGKLLLYSLSEATESEFTIQNGEADLGYLPEGEYLVRVILDGVEVSRELFNPAETNELNLVCRVSNARIAVKDLDFNPIKNLTIILRGVSEYSATTGIDGIAYFNQIPLSAYEVYILSNDTLLHRDSIDLNTRNEFNIVLEFRSLRIKVVNIFGNPIKGAQIVLSSQDHKIERVGVTDKDGKILFDLLPLGVYEVTCRVGNYKKVSEFILSSEGSNFVTVKTDVYFTLFGIAIDAGIILVIGAIIFIILIFIKKSREKGEIEIA